MGFVGGKKRLYAAELDMIDGRTRKGASHPAFSAGNAGILPAPGSPCPPGTRGSAPALFAAAPLENADLIDLIDRIDLIDGRPRKGASHPAFSAGNAGILPAPGSPCPGNAGILPAPGSPCHPGTRGSAPAPFAAAPLENADLIDRIDLIDLIDGRTRKGASHAAFSAGNAGILPAPGSPPRERGAPHPLPSPPPLIRKQPRRKAPPTSHLPPPSHPCCGGARLRQPPDYRPMNGARRNRLK